MFVVVVGVLVEVVVVIVVVVESVVVNSGDTCMQWQQSVFRLECSQSPSFFEPADKLKLAASRLKSTSTEKSTHMPVLPYSRPHPVSMQLPVLIKDHSRIIHEAYLRIFLPH